MPRVTIARLQEAISEVTGQRDEVNKICNNLRDKDEKIREELTKVLGPMEVYPGERSRATMSWFEIFCAIGELKADADIHCLMAKCRRQDKEIEDLKFKLNNTEKE